MSERYEANAGELDRRDRLAEHVSTGLSDNEQETTIQFFGDADRYSIESYRPTIVRSLLRHRYAEIEWVYLRVPESQNQRVSDLSEILRSEATVRVGGVRATLPLGTLSVKGKPRSRDQHSGIVTTTAESERVNAAFTDGGDDE